MNTAVRLRRVGIGLLAAAVLSSGGVAFGQTEVPTRRAPSNVGDPAHLADFLAGIAGRVKPSDQVAAGARQRAAIEAAKAAQPTGPRRSLAPTLPAGVTIGPGSTPDYYSTPNWAFSPPLVKFVDPLPNLWDPRGGGVAPAKCIPLAVPDTRTFPGSDYYEIELRQYQEKLHSTLPATTLRGYVQVNKGTNAAGTAEDVVPAPNRYLGPLIVATKDRPIRIKFVNALPTGPSGKLMVPVDTTIMGSGPFEINWDPQTKLPFADPTTLITGDFAQNRATLHLHGGRTPWISDGTPHQWIVPAGEPTVYDKGVSVENVPDMWFYPAGHPNAGAVIASCSGLSSCPEPGATTDPGPGAQTFYWTNQQSARLMFYHDHAWGITRLNVYVGEAAGYLITDDAEKKLVADGLIPAAQIPLVIQDKTFVDPATIATTDPTWAWGTQPWDGTPGAAMAPQAGDLWWPHVYMPAQNPYNPDMSGINAMGRWHYGPWFWPPTPVCGSTPQAVKPWCVDVGAQPNPYYDPLCDPAVAGFCQPPEIPGTPSTSWGAEAFLDTMLVNGAVYPTLELAPGQYRLRILNASHDRFLNLQFYQAVSKVGYTNPTVAPYDLAGAGLADLTEVAMVPASANAAFPPLWPTDGREGGVPDPALAGPAMIQIGTEGGFLPGPVLLPNQPIQWNLDPTMFNVGNVLPQPEGGGTLMLGPAERGDVIVDFSNFAGKTLILYNDAPTAFPALDPHYDFYTGAPDRTDIGGAPAIPPGVGPNNRTVMQIHITGTGGTAPVNDFNPTTLANLQAAFATTGTPADPPTYAPGVFAKSQEPIIVGQKAYETTYNTTFPGTWPNWGVSRIGDNAISFVSVNPDGTTTAPMTVPMLPKAIHDEMGGSFDDFGRMSAKLGLEVKNATTAISTFALQNYVDPPSEFTNPNEIQLWKITHNGVDTHPIHFHLFDVQVVNRVGWDGFIRLPDPNEIGWKDTVRISPLEDTIVALRPVVPSVPFPLPDSIRPLNPEAPLGSMMGFSQIDPATGGAVATPMENALFDFGWEYVWHCHILSHEENDMMRSMVFQMSPAAPSLVAAPAVAPGTGVDLTWTDNAASETGFTLQRSGDPTFPVLLTTTFPALPPSAPSSAWNVTLTYNDATAPAGQLYYRIQAFSPNGASAWSNVAPVSATPLANVAPTGLAFGGIALGATSTPQTVTLTNAGTAVLSISSITIGGAAAAEFVQTNACGPTLDAGASCAITVSFAPSALGGRTATLDVASNNPFPLSVSLTGTGLGPVAGITPASLAFGNQFVTTASAAQTVRLSNTGNAVLLINSIAVTGVNFDQFGQTGTCGASLAPGTTCTIDVTFAPTALGPLAADLTVGTNDALRPTTVALTGTGVALPFAAVAPTTFAFGDVLLTKSLLQTFTLSNTGGSDLTGVTVTLTGANAAQYALTNNCAATLAGPLGTCTIDVTFAPTALGPLPASLTIASNDPFHSPLTVPLTGNGIQAVASLSPTALDFGNVGLGASGSLGVVLSNTGNTALTGITLTPGGANAADFSFVNSCGTSLAAGSNCVIVVNFAPTAAGPRAGTLTIANSNDFVNPSFLVSLTGAGLQPIAGISPSSGDFGSQLVFTASAAKPVTLSNGGNGPLTVTSIVFGGANPADFGQVNTCGPLPATVAAGASCTINVTFTPQALNARGATMTVGTNDPLHPTSVTLTGTGIDVPPAAPSGMTAVASALAATPPTVTLTWVDNSYNETGFMVQRSTNSGFTANLVAFNVGAGTTSFIDGTPKINTKYWYRVMAFNGVGTSAFSASAAATTPGWLPAAPTNLVATAATTTSITLGWTDNATNESGFRVQRSGDGVNWTTIANPGANVVSYKATGLTRNKTYYFRVRASNGSGASTWSSTLVTKTLP